MWFMSDKQKTAKRERVQNSGIRIGRLKVDPVFMLLFLFLTFSSLGLLLFILLGGK